MFYQSNYRLSNEIFLIMVIVFFFTPGVTAQSSSERTVNIRSEVYSVARTQFGDKKLRMDLYISQTDSIKGAIILVHGGSFVRGSRNFKENEVYGMALANRGYLAAAISYRLHGDKPLINGWAKAYARKIRQSSNSLVQSMMDRYGSDLAKAVAASARDIVAAVDWLRNHASDFGFSPDDIALFGASAGAISSLTVAYALDNYGAEPMGIAAVIDLRGLFVQLFLQHSEPGSLIQSQDPPLLIFHGKADKRIPLHYAESLFKVAKKAGIYVEFFSASGFGHELGGSKLLNLKVERNQTVLDRMNAFLEASFGENPMSSRSLRNQLLERK